MSKDHLDVLKESQWEIHRKFPIPEHILVPSTEVENKTFSKFPWLSSCYQRGDTLFRAQLDEVPYVGCESYVRGCDIFVNPWIIPELQSTIQLAQNMVGKRKSSYLNRLPLEISLLVAEIICPIIYTQSDVQKIRNMLSVLALNLPDAFWRSRLQSKRDLFFEVDLLD
ncbi:hypothetical protein PCH_Pc14g00440 [Penicillium rubens Wisconsin 54-1255]|uniref:Uncharacterized protein n=1 Tax=Penicillium rubens (strain ATCC 28089 / DSM 1075 / NRRL 1951 / Wisconsin 54-1255) TaxID=500485 RepID=B6H5L3_PENRW|nr:hypothetical protein PCH_Pc14g00440 [Penicillium rubens Wisconsin 54-1255]